MSSSPYNISTYTFAEIEQRYSDNHVYPNIYRTGERRRDDVPMDGLIVMAYLSPADGHECQVYEVVEGCIAPGHEPYAFVAWIDDRGGVHYVEPVEIVEP